MPLVKIGYWVCTTDHEATRESGALTMARHMHNHLVMGSTAVETRLDLAFGALADPTRRADLGFRRMSFERFRPIP